MKKMKIMLAAISMIVLLFCGSDAQAQSIEAVALSEKNLVDLSTVDLLDSDQANEVLLSEYQNLDKSIDAEHITMAFYRLLMRDIHSGKSVENALVDNRDSLGVIAARIQDNTTNLENIYNGAVALLEN
jgi:hypothetical protein